MEKALGQQGKAPGSSMKVAGRLQRTVSIPALLQGTSRKWHQWGNLFQMRKQRCAWVGKLQLQCWRSPPWKAERAAEALQPHAEVSPPLDTWGRCAWGSPGLQLCIRQGALGGSSSVWRKLMYIGECRSLCVLFRRILASTLPGN